MSPLSADLLLDTIKFLERRAAGLLEMARFVREPGDFHDVLGKLLAKAAEIVGADAGVIALADQKSGKFSFVNVHYASLPPLEAEKKEKMLQLIRLNLADGIIGKVYLSGEPVTLSDLSREPGFRKDVADTVDYEVRNLLAVPLVAEGERMGVMELLNKNGEGPFLPADIDLASALSTQLALVVEAHRLREEGKAQGQSQGAAPLLVERKDLEARLSAAEAAAKGAVEAGEVYKKEIEALRRGLEESKKEADVLRASAVDSRAAVRAREEAERALESVRAQLADARQESDLLSRENQLARQHASQADEHVQRLKEELSAGVVLREKSDRRADDLARVLDEKARMGLSKERQEALMRAFSAVSSNQPTDVVLEVLMNAVAASTEAEAASLLLVDEDTGRLFFAAATGLKKDPLKKVLLNEGEGIAGWVAKNGKILNIPDVARDPRFSDKADASAGFKTRSVLAVPLFSEGRLLGVAEVVNKKAGGAFNEEDHRTLISLALYGAMTIRKAQIYWDMNDLFLSTVRVLADAIDARGAGGKGRAERVRRLTLALAEEGGAPAEIVRDLELAALLHDVGKISLPETLLKKHGDLTEEEAHLVARTPLVGAEILSPAKPLLKAVTMVRHVHERWDGMGYPDHLKGDAIPVGARLISVAVTYEAMVADRPYRRSLPVELAVKEIQALRGIQLDPAAVDALTRLYRKGRLKDLFK